LWLPDGVLMDERCCFGDAAAAVKCVRISNFLVFQIRRAIDEFDAAHPTREAAWAEWQQRRRAAAAARGAGQQQLVEAARLHWVAMYVDDQMGGSADDLLFGIDGAPVMIDGVHARRSTAHFRIARATIERFGWRSAPKKEQPPGVTVEVLGAEIDIVGGRWRLAPLKRKRYAEAVEAIGERRYVQSAEMISLLGKLSFAAQCYPLGRQFLHASWRAARARSRTAAGLVRTSKAVRAELRWWSEQLRAAEPPSVPLVARDPMPPPGSGSGVIYADASGSGGFAAWTMVDRKVIAVAGEWEPEERDMLICDLELLASTIGVVALSPFLPSDIYSFTDNTVAQAAMRRLRAESAPMQRMLHRRTLWMHERGIVEQTRRIASAANLWADIGSRPEKGGVAEVERQARALGFDFVRVGMPAGWRQCWGE
jgi:hypothetical protein